MFRCSRSLARIPIGLQPCLAAMSRPMPNPENPPSPQLFFDTMNALQKTGALKAAIDLGLFTAIGGAPATATEGAARCQCPEPGVRILCDSLTIFGFLIKDGARYALTPDSAFF